MIWYDMIWYDMIWYDMIWFDMIWYDMIWYDLIWFDLIWYDMIWYDMIWYDMIWYINNSLHLARKYAQIFVRGRYLFREEEQIMSKDKYLSIFFKSNWARLLCLLSFKYFSQHARSASLSYVNHVNVFQLASKISTSFNSDFASVESICLRKKYIILKEKIIPCKTKSKIQVVDKVTGNLTTFREQDQSNIAFRKICKPPWTKLSRRFAVLVLLPRVQLEQYFMLKIQLWTDWRAENDLWSSRGWTCSRIKRHRMILLRALSLLTWLSMEPATKLLTIDEDCTCCSRTSCFSS